MTEQRSPYDNFAELVGQYTDKPLTQEERARRERAATAAQGMGALGNAISAFSNLAFTGGVAPSQKLPALPDTDKDIQAFRARIDKNRAAYLNNLLQGEGLKRQAEEIGLKRRDLARKEANDEREAKNKKDLNDAKIERMRHLNDKDDSGKAYWDAKVQALEEGLPLDLAEKRARVAKYNAEAYRARNGGGGGGGNYVPVEIVDPATGKLKTIYVTGNKAADIYAGQEGDDSNRSSSESVDAFGGKSTKTTEKGKTAKQKSAEHTRQVREEKEKQKQKQQKPQNGGQKAANSKALSSFSIHKK